MNINNAISKAINDKLIENSGFEFVAGLKDLTVSDIDCIEEIFTSKNIKAKLTYQIVDNIYIKIAYSL